MEKGLIICSDKGSRSRCAFMCIRKRKKQNALRPEKARYCLKGSVHSNSPKQCLKKI